MKAGPDAAVIVKLSDQALSEGLLLMTHRRYKNDVGRLLNSTQLVLLREAAFRFRKHHLRQARSMKP